MILTQPLPNTALLLQEMPVKWMEVRRASREHCERTRAEYEDNKVSQRFRQYALEACCRALGHQIPLEELTRITEKYNVHHKQPIEFGGMNDFDNLVLIYPPAHRSIHKRVKRIIQSFEDLKVSYEAAIPQSERYEILDKLRNVQGLHTSHQITEIRAFIQYPYPAGSFYIPHLAGCATAPA